MEMAITKKAKRLIAALLFLFIKPNSQSVEDKTVEFNQLII